MLLYTSREENVGLASLPGAIVGHDPPATVPGWFNYTSQIGSALKLMRIRKRMLQKDLAKALSKELSKRIRPGAISKIESSKKGVSLERLGLLCKLLNCT